MIWNERRINIWLIVEFILVFCILWFCFDFLSTTVQNYLRGTGFDIENTYRITLSQKRGEAAVELDPEMTELHMTLLVKERISRYPGIEALSFSRHSIPNVLSSSGGSYRIESDSTNTMLYFRDVTPEFFEVFRIPLQRGEIFDWPDDTKVNRWVFYPDGSGKIGDYPVEEVHSVNNGDRPDRKYTVAGYTYPLRSNFFDPFSAGVFRPMGSSYFRLRQDTEITVRVRPEIYRDFPEKFRKEMAEQLNIGNYYLASIRSFADMEKDAAYQNGISGKLNSIFAITAFVIVNIFLGILGSFWFRTQSRRSEIGLRIALGASKRKVKNLLLGETLLLLSLAAIVGTLICLHIGSTELIQDLGIPYTDRQKMGIGGEQDFINFGLTFAFLALVSIVSVWYPASQASKTQPAEALHEE